MKGDDTLIRPIMNHGLILSLSRSNSSTGHADLAVSADWLTITVRRMGPAELRDLAAALVEYAGRLEGT